ncbi:SAVED domain-containing protein [Aerococcus urinaeequi]|uniref:SAVED domain-containing protein n=1 Tax=Aerococcus urinaeequi TaxID=51665 RepID=UPI003AAFBF2B
MEIKNIVNIAIWIILIAYSIKTVFKKDEEKDIPTTLILGGLGVFTSDLDFLINYINPSANISENTNNVLYIIGLILIILGIAMNYLSNKQHHVFNLLGENNKKELINNNYKVQNITTGIIRERSIDIMRLSEGKEMNEEINESMINIILNETNIINNYAVNNGIYLTSMASIPHSILFGTYLTDKKTIKYLNYNNSISEYVLLPNKVQKKQKINLNIDEKLSRINPEDCSEVLVSISGTFTVHEKDISEFQLNNHVSIETSDILQNNISSQEEVVSIAHEIVSTLMDLSKTYDVIHIVAAIPGMLSIELGRKIRSRDNQLKEIIVYHYNVKSNPKYEYGIVINGNSKNKLIERGI